MSSRRRSISAARRATWRGAACVALHSARYMVRCILHVTVLTGCTLGCTVYAPRCCEAVSRGPAAVSGLRRPRYRRPTDPARLPRFPRRLLRHSAVSPPRPAWCEGARGQVGVAACPFAYNAKAHGGRVRSGSRSRSYQSQWWARDREGQCGEGGSPLHLDTAGPKGIVLAANVLLATLGSIEANVWPADFPWRLPNLRSNGTESWGWQPFRLGGHSRRGHSPRGHSRRRHTCHARL